MNQQDPIAAWRAEPRLPAKSQKGWTVVFAQTASGARPALDYMQGADEDSESIHPFTRKQLNQMAGYVATILFEGPLALPSSNQFRTFKGKDALDGMCEFRFGSNQGHRLLAFRQKGQVLVVASGFVKPPRAETPSDKKERAKRILKEHRAAQEAAGRSRHHGH